jgi:hypothetical protein
MNFRAKAGIKVMPIQPLVEKIKITIKDERGAVLCIARAAKATEIGNIRITSAFCQTDSVSIIPVIKLIISGCTELHLR